MAKVSVIVPVFNAEKYLKQCIESLVNQLMKDIEIIFVDDGSEDNSVSIIKSYAEKDSRIKLLTQSHSFAGAARNKGLETATGEYLIFLDADDYFECDMLFEMYIKAVSDDADVCICSAKRFNDQTGEITEPAFYLNTSAVPKHLPFSACDIKEKIFNFTSPAPWTKLFKTSFVQSNNIKFQSVRKTNDLFFVFANFALAEKITFVNKPFVNYRYGNSASLQGEKNVLNFEFLEALLALKKELQRRKLFSDFEKSFVNRALSVCVYVLNSADSKENYIKTAHFLKNKCFVNLGIAGHSRGYFYTKADFDVFLDVIALSEEELWNKYNTPAECKDAPLIDIDAWQRDFEIPKDNSIKISVIIPVYNASEYIAQCINSVTTNTFKDIEIICVNDGSTDNSLEILTGLSEKDSRIIVLNKENGGPSAARNMGLDIAKGEYISFVDSDDYIHEKTYEFLYTELKKNNLDQLYFSAVSVFDDDVENQFGEFKNLYKRNGSYPDVVTGKKLFCSMVENKEFRPTPWSLISKREFYESYKLRFFNGLLHEDNLFIIQSLAFAERVKFYNVNLYNRRIHKDSIMTGNNDLKRVYSYYKIIKILEQFAKENNLNADKDYFEALKYQLFVINCSACDRAERLTQQELEHFADTLDAAEAIDFHNHIIALTRIRTSNKTLVAREKNAQEIEKITEYKFRTINDNLNSENQMLKVEKSKLETENKKLKFTLSKKLVRIALKIDAFLAKLRSKK